MTHDEFEEIFDRMIARSHEVLVAKAAEYATEDRLHNFRKAANLLGSNNRQALAGMWVKHIVSVFDLIESEELADQAVWDEKIGDAFNYLILLQAVIDDERKANEAKQLTFVYPTISPRTFTNASYASLKIPHPETDNEG